MVLKLSYGGDRVGFVTNAILLLSKLLYRHFHPHILQFVYQ